jgi:hypothetical protein
LEKSRNLELVGASPTEWQLIKPRGGPCGPPPGWNRVNKYFSLVLGLLKSRISEKINQGFLNKLDFKLFHYKARVQPVRKITTIATRNRC